MASRKRSCDGIQSISERKPMKRTGRKESRDEVQSKNEPPMVPGQIVATMVKKKEGTAVLTEEFSDSSFISDVCELKQLLTDLVEYLHNTFAMLHSECKEEKNSPMQFQLRWYSYCSAFLLEEKYTLGTINLELTNCKQVLEFCRERLVFVQERNSVMTTLSSVYHCLLDHVVSFQES